jgi:hypothetical protein
MPQQPVEVSQKAMLQAMTKAEIKRVRFTGRSPLCLLELTQI